MKKTFKSLINHKVSILSLLTIFLQIFQLFGPAIPIASAKTLKINEIELDEGSLELSSSNIYTRPSFNSDPAKNGDRYSLAELNGLMNDLIIGSKEEKFNTNQTNPQSASPLLFIENKGQSDVKQSFEIHQNNSIIRFTKDSIWFTLLDPDITSSIDAMSSIMSENYSSDIENQNTKTEKGINIQIKFVDANSESIIEGIQRSTTKISYFYGNDETNWRPDVPVWTGIRYIDLYPGVNMEINGANGTWVWKLIVQDSNRLLIWANEKKKNDLRFKILGTQKNQNNNDCLQFTSEIGNLILPDVQIVWNDDNPFGTTHLTPQLTGKDLILLSYDQIEQNLSPESQKLALTETPTEVTPTFKPTGTETPLPTETYVFPDITETETVIPTFTEDSIEENPEIEPAVTEPISLLDNGGPTENSFDFDFKAMETPTLTITEAPSEETQRVEPTATETPSPTSTIFPAEEPPANSETPEALDSDTPFFEETYVWDFSGGTYSDSLLASTDSIVGE
jgi:hypothetical protein